MCLFRSRQKVLGGFLRCQGIDRHGIGGFRKKIFGRFRPRAFYPEINESLLCFEINGMGIRYYYQVVVTTCRYFRRVTRLLSTFVSLTPLASVPIPESFSRLIWHTFGGQRQKLLS